MPFIDEGVHLAFISYPIFPHRIIIIIVKSDKYVIIRLTELFGLQMKATNI